MSRLAEYLLQNEQTHFRHNKELMSIANLAPSGLKMDLTCECGDDECTNKVEATIEEWENYHRKDLAFMVAPDHYFPRFEDVIKKTPRFWVVKKKEERLQSQ